MPEDNIASYNLRLNLDNEQHMRIYKVLSDLNLAIHKSKNKFIVEALDFYIRSFDEEDLVKKVAQARAKKQGWVSRNDFESLKAEMKIEVRNEIIQLLGSMILGNQINVLQPTIEDTKADQSRMIEYDSEDEFVGMTNQEAISLISSWG